MKHLLLLLPAALLLTLAGLSSAYAGSSRDDLWLNARDCGASGSSFETTASATAGSKQVVLTQPGDFQPGQGVMISRCRPQFTRCILKPPENPFATTPLGDAAELRGYDGSGGGWLVFLVEINGTGPLTFRWSDDLARTWKGARVPVTFDWQPLGSGIEIKLRKQDWRPGHILTFHARDMLVTRVEKVEGKLLTLADPATRTVKDALVRHCDSDALQSAASRAVKEKRNLFLPAGHYRLLSGLSVSGAAAISIEGAASGETLLDISEGYGTCLSLRGGTEVTLRNLRMVGHTGLGDGPGWHSFPTSSGKACWPVGLKPCSALHITNTERVLVENCHASKMNCEAFYCQGSSRSGASEPPAYTKSLTYLRCSATNCDGNGFNNNDLAENTSVLHCRIVDVGGCTWEGASRFVRFIGNYVRNSGTVAMGNIRSRAEHLEQLGSAQHIVADNVFEGRTFYNGRPGGYIVRATDGATQVIIRNNLFVNFNSCGIEVSAGGSDQRSLTTGYCTVSGNILDMSAAGEPSRTRTAIHVAAPDVLVSDNQVYVRGACDPNVTAIRLTEPAVNLLLHDNLVRNCGVGILSDTAYSAVGEVVGPDSFKAGRGTIPLERRLSTRYAGWKVAWFKAAKPDGASVVASFDPETLVFRLTQARLLTAGDRFEVFAPAANWNLHDNTITGCAQPAVFNGHGSATSFFRDNLIERGGAAAAEQPISGSARMDARGNRVVGW